MPRHVPVLLQESIEALDLKPGEIFLDATFGAGGHSREVRERFGDKVQIIGLDRDPSVAEKNPEFEIKTECFRNLDKVLGEFKPDAILFDLGLSSDQLEDSGRGFSFLKDEPLDMRMSREGITAADILNFWDEPAIELILRGFGEERFSKKIARAIVERRAAKPFKTTFDLVKIVKSVIPHFAPTSLELRGARKASRGKHPATKTFQALRIATNEELSSLETGLEKGFRALGQNGRLAVISFHSLEDRIVKNFFRDKTKEETAKLITPKPITPSAEEVERNPRSRSAKLRIIEKI